MSPSPAPSNAPSRPRRRGPSVLLWTTLLATACAAPDPAGGPPGPQGPDEGAGDPAAGTPTATSTEARSEDPRPADVLQLVSSGDYRAAHSLLSTLLLEEELQSGADWLAAGSPADALVAIDRALELDEDQPEALFLKARASFALGERAIQTGGSSSLVVGSFEDALEHYRRGGDHPNALLGASRAAIRLQRYDEGLSLAQSALGQLDADGLEPSLAGERSPSVPGLETTDGLVVEVVPERVLAEAAYRSFVDAKQTDPEAASTADLFRTTEDALDRLLGRSQDSWTWTTLVDLYLWEEDLDAARAQAENGLARDPQDAALVDRLANVAHRQGGPSAMASAFQAFNERHPGVARGVWYEAQGRFDAATDAIMPRVAEAITGGADTEAAPADGGDAEPASGGEAEAEAGTEEAPPLLALERVPDTLDESDALFRRCREMDASYTSACLGYEALTRNARGWLLFSEGRLDEATAAFESTEEVYEGGLFAELEGRLLSGVQGIAQVGAAYNAREDWRRAGAAFERIAAVDRSRSTWSNNQGFFYRDAGVQLEELGRALCAAAQEGRRDEALLGSLATLTGTDLRGEGTGDPAALMRRASDLAMDEARAQMQKSWEGYRVAAELAPEDVRIVNDAGLVLVYYLHEQLDLAESLLLRAAEMGEEQMAAADANGLDEDQRFEVANAWGDAYQNLGVLYANHRDDPDTATDFFERAIEIGPEARLLLTNFWLPFLRGELEGQEIPDELRLKTWADPCR